MRKATGLPHSHWWAQLPVGETLKSGDQIWCKEERKWIPHFSFGIVSHAEKAYHFRRKYKRRLDKCFFHSLVAKSKAHFHAYGERQK